MKKIEVKWMMILAMMVLPFLINAQPGQGRMSPRGERGMNGDGQSEMMKIPNLTEEQAAQIQEIRLAARQENLSLSNELNERQAKLQTLQTASNADMVAITSEINEMAMLRAKMEIRRAEAHQEVRKLLTDEQRTVLDSRFQRFQGKRMGNRR